ncbi:hypothetical protein L0663_00930 [Dyadobacter sp. CY107]|uniref:hypothetical protein n=1 Tax=Dyadobacter fanqingshengii TaxID=2906443 RepID=UPI001F2697E0|nr:hypothetical protein [Dyadobacter fanqingshengii]MCF2501926.1 hypothetical protein [Dyadobacter fanqingshengii]
MLSNTRLPRKAENNGLAGSELAALIHVAKRKYRGCCPKRLGIYMRKRDVQAFH